MKIYEKGRSMIEMLGVLAIIGVLSVGGIAGYSKAMEKFKLNKTIEEYSYMLFGIVEHLDDWKNVSVYNNTAVFVDWIQAMNLVPATWQKDNTINAAMKDNNGNILQGYKTKEMNGMLLVDFFLGGWSQSEKGWSQGEKSFSSISFSPKLCVEMFNNIMTPLHSAVYSVNTWNSVKGDITFYGDSYCSAGRSCLSNATLAQIKAACEHCEDSVLCCITIRFPL